MERTYRTKAETADYFIYLSEEFEKQSIRAEQTHEHGDAEYFRGKAEAYRLSAFELLRNTI